MGVWTPRTATDAVSVGIWKRRTQKTVHVLIVSQGVGSALKSILSGEDSAPINKKTSPGSVLETLQESPLNSITTVGDNPALYGS